MLSVQIETCGTCDMTCFTHLYLNKPACPTDLLKLKYEYIGNLVKHTHRQKRS